MLNPVEERQKLQALADTLPAALGDGWAFDPPGPEGGVWLNFKHPSGTGFHVSLKYQGRDVRFQISGDYHGLQEHVAYKAVRPCITVSAVRSPVGIAADLQRRFLPDYLVTWADAKNRKAEHDAGQVRAIEVANELATILEEPVSKSNGLRDSELTVHFYSEERGHGQMRVNWGGTSVRINVDIPTDAAKQIARIIGPKQQTALDKHLESVDMPQE